MTIPYSLRQQGWMQADNGAPCITAEQARVLNLPLDYAKRSVLEVDLLHCKHCGGAVVKNPDRVRSRGHCMKCNWYVCDPCALEMGLPDYVHAPFLEKVARMKASVANLTCI